MRISATTLESFRLFMDPSVEWMTADELLKTIRGEFAGNHKTWLGDAFGAVLEHPERYRVSGGYRVQPRRSPDVFELGDDVMGPALALIDRPVTVFEAKAIGRYGRHEVVAKADQMVGIDLIETKTTQSGFDFHKYADGCQWKFMADIFHPGRITYHVFCLDEDESNGVIRLKSIETFRLYPYVGMSDYLRGLVQEFEAFAEQAGVVDLLDQRQREAA